MSLRFESTAVATAAARGRRVDYLELTKPRITTLVLVTTLVGFELAASLYGVGTTALEHLLLLASALVGTALVAAGAGTLNHVVEEDVDKKMLRTRGRPIPAGRLTKDEALIFGVTLGVAGILWLAVSTNVLAALVAASTLALYVFVYTPLKRHTPLSTIVGAVPGALPPVIGWAAAAGNIEARAWVPFAIMFVWQLPHFYAIAWMYREDYARGGLAMLPVVDKDGHATSRQIAATSAALLPISLAPTVVGMTGNVYFAGAALLGLGMLILGFRLAATRSDAHARTLFLASIVYLPALLALMMVDHLWL